MYDEFKTVVSVLLICTILTYCATSNKLYKNL